MRTLPEGRSQGEVTKLLGVSTRAVSNSMDGYRRRGLAAVVKGRRAGKRRR